MDSSTYPATEGSDNNCSYHSNTLQVLDLVDQWINFTVEDEVVRGCQLREEKNKTCVPQTECRLVNVNDNRSPYIENVRSKSKPRCRTPSYGYSPAYCSPPRSPSTKSKCPQRCPLRIAELAVPSKRQCIETWRTKCDVLPPYMVERLKHQVLDERPLIPISDAVGYFNTRKPKTAKSTKSSKKNHLSKTDRDRKIRDDRMFELRQLCAIFGKKIAQKLITPQNLKLNPELSKISKIVADEVALIMKGDKYKNDNLHDKMHAEISSKIAVWIHTVLEDTSYKLLEEDLKAKKRTNMTTEDCLLTLVKHQSGFERTELEEEEGPVLDFLDDVFENVMKICIPEDVGVLGDYASGEEQYMSIASPDSLENNEFDTSTPHTSITYETGDNGDVIDKNNDIKGDIENEIQKVIDSVVRDDEEDLPNIGLENKRVFSNLLPDEFLNIAHEVYDVDESIPTGVLIQDNSADVSEVMPVEDFSIATDNLDLGIKTDSKSETDVSDVFGIFAEESYDDKNKKVKFSDIDLGPGGRFQLDEKGNPMIVNHVKNNIGATHTDSQNITFAPPNDHLLSDADESWPQYLPFPALKATESVSKSVTSLGNIQENEEKLSSIITGSDLQKELFSKQGDTEDLDKINTKDEKLLKGKEAGIIDEQVKPTQSDENKENLTNIMLEGTDKVRGGTGGISNMNKSILQKTKPTSGNEAENANHDLQSKAKSSDTEQQNGAVGDDSHTNVIYQAVEQKMKASSVLPEPKFDYKVNPNTAPSWLRHDHGKGEPSEDSIDARCRSKGKVKECDIRMWCKDLERMYANMDLWRSWLETTCKNVTCLKQKKGDNSESNKLLNTHVKSKSAREWVALKKDIDKDAILWTKLYQRANEKLQWYQARCIPEERNEPKRTYVRSPQRSQINKIVFQSMDDVDRMSLWIHRTIVSTEYCMLCDCKNNFIKRKL